MPGATLSVEQTAKLIGLIESDATPFAELAPKVTETFGADNAALVLACLRSYLDFAHASELEVSALVASINALFLLHHAGTDGGQGLRRGPHANAAKASMWRLLQRAENGLRDDARTVETLKYKSSAATGTRKMTAHDATEMDAGRAHMLLKAIVFRLALNAFDKNKSARDLLAAERSDLETEAESWHTTPALKQALVEATSDMKSAAESEAALCSTSRAVPVTVAEPSKTPEVFAPQFRRPQPTTLPIAASELRFVAGASFNATLSLDTRPHKADWATASRIVEAARQGEISSAQQQQLIQLLADKALVARVGLSVTAFLDIVRHNPQTAAGIVPLVAPAEPYLDALLGLPNATGALATPVVLAATKLMQPHHVTMYARAMATHVRTAAKTEQQRLVGSFAVTLHQLVGTTLAKQDADVVVPLFNEFATVGDVSSLWGSVLKA